MKLFPPFRPAVLEDCIPIAALFSIASEGVANYVWSTLQSDYPGLSLLEIGAARYADDQALFSYKNTVVAEHNGEVIGMMLTFPIAESEEESEAIAELQSESGQPDVLAPYALEAPGTWYICALALFPDFRGQGLGTQFLAIAREQARQNGFKALSLLCFEENFRAFNLYQRNGFEVIDRRAIVPHQLIHVTGDVLLMTSSVDR